MQYFIQKYGHHLTGTLCGFDRLLLKGSLRMISFVDGLAGFLTRSGVLLKDFGEYVRARTEQLIAASLADAKRLDRPIVYLPSSSTDKEKTARALAEKHHITDGLVCVLKSVELCQGFDIHRNRAAKTLDLVPRQRKCLHLYHYRIDPVFGWMHARIQTWLPFTVQVCLNGREYLARRLDEKHIGYRRQDNGFLRIDDPDRAQELMDGMLHLDWPSALDPFARMLNPAHDAMFRIFPMPYYWTVRQMEWALDFMFDSKKALAAVYPAMTRGAMTAFSCQDVLRFLGRRITADSDCEVTGHYRERPEGVRIKHAVGGNSVKAYDKFGRILRVETTTTNPRELKVFRTAEGDPEGEKRWMRMRHGVADLHRRAEVSQRCAERYADALSALDTEAELGRLVEPVCRRKRDAKGRSIRGLRVWDEGDMRALREANRGEHAVNGFRNRDVAGAIRVKGETGRATTARATRVIRLLREHGLIRKIGRTHRYQVTRQGRLIMTALLQADHVSLSQLNRIAA